MKRVKADEGPANAGREAGRFANLDSRYGRDNGCRSNGLHRTQDEVPQSNGTSCDARPHSKRSEVD